MQIFTLVMLGVYEKWYCVIRKSIVYDSRFPYILYEILFCFA